MSEEIATDDGRNSWSAFSPSDAAPWTLRRVVQLHRRAGFGASWAEIQRDLIDGPKVSIDRLLKGQGRGSRVPADFVHVADLLADSAVAARDPGRLKAWWLYRMLYGPDSLGERLTLLWHNHFATSNLKVNDLSAMRRQNDLFRSLTRAPFGKLLEAAVRDPALLVWLDAPANRKAHPNENLARELMELFTLGLGPFSEGDVKEAARALTGWSVVEGEFRIVEKQHDDGEKLILGQRGRWRGVDLVRILLEHPATAQRLAVRLCELFMGEGAVDAPAIRSLAEGLRKHDLDVGWGVETILRSRAFFAERNIGSRVRGPVEWVVGAVRALEMEDASPSTLVLAEWCTRLGQDLFYPPNVFGWPGGRAWLSTRSIIARNNFAADLARAALAGKPEAWDALALARKHGRGNDLADVAGFYSELLLGITPDASRRERILSALGPKPALTSQTCARIVALVLASPEAQVG